MSGDISSTVRLSGDARRIAYGKGTGDHGYPPFVDVAVEVFKSTSAWRGIQVQMAVAGCTITYRNLSLLIPEPFLALYIRTV